MEKAELWDLEESRSLREINVLQVLDVVGSSRRKFLQSGQNEGTPLLEGSNNRRSQSSASIRRFILWCWREELEEASDVTTSELKPSNWIRKNFKNPEYGKVRNLRKNHRRRIQLHRMDRKQIENTNY